MPIESQGEFDLENYDMNSPVLARDWDRVVPKLHSECPVTKSDDGEGYWVVSGHKEIVALASNWKTFSNAAGFMPNRPKDMPRFLPEESDPPFHTAIRRPLTPLLGPRVIRRIEKEIIAHANYVLDQIEVDSGMVDIVTEYANVLPARVFMISLAGLPVEDLPWLQERMETNVVGPVEERGKAFADAQAYLAGFLERAKHRSDNTPLVQAILDLDVDGFDWAARVSTMSNLTSGGVGTTGYVLASAILHLSQHPLQAQLLRTEPARMPSAVEEFLRFFAASPHDARRVMERVDVTGHEFQEGDCVVLNYGAGSRDPKVFEDADKVDLERGLPNKHLSFGWGVHRCIGSHLARSVLSSGISCFLDRYETFDAANDFQPEYQIGTTRVLLSLPMRLTLAR